MLRNDAGFVVTVDDRGEVVAANVSFEALPDRSDGVLSRRVLLDACLRVLGTGGADTFDLVDEGPGGPIAAFRCHVTPMRRADGSVVGCTAACLDVTSQAREADRLRRHAALLVDAEGVAQLGTWDWVQATDEVVWSEELYRIFGETRETHTPTSTSYLERVVPEDREQVAAVLDRAVREHVAFSHDERIRRPDGSVRDLHSWGRPILDDDGNLVRLLGVCQDITDRRDAEREKLETLAILDAVVEGTTDLVFVKDLDGRYLLVNTAAAGAISHTKDEVIGRTDYDLFPHECADRLRANDLSTVRLARTETHEETVPTATGDRTFLVTRDPFRDVHGRIAGTIGIARDISELIHRRSERERLLSLQAATIESTADGLLVIGEQGGIVSFNERLLEIWQLPSGSLDRKTYHEALDLVFGILEEPETCARRFEEILADPTGESFDVLRLRTGRILERYSRPQILAGRTIGRVFSYRDITERAEAERALRESEAKMRVLAETSRALAGARLDLDAIAKAAARRIARAFDDGSFVRIRRSDDRDLPTVAYDHADADALGSMNAVVPGAHGFLDAEIERDIATTGRAVLLSVPPSEGRHLVRPAAWSFLDRYPVRSWIIVPLAIAGDVLGYAVAFRSRAGPDYTDDDRDFLQRLVGRVAVEVDNARLHLEAQRAVRLRDEFILAVSHELRTPLTPLKVRLQLLSDAVRSLPEPRMPERRTVLKFVDGGIRDVERLVRLISGMVDVSRLEGDDLTLTSTEVDLVERVRVAVDRLRPELDAAHCEVQLLGDATAVGSWDRDRIDQVIVGLLSNAMKFGVGKPIPVTIEHGPDRVRLIVRDFGIGISTDDQARIFERYARAAPTRNFAGLGLGLYVVRRVVEAHGGTVRIDSAPGQGSSFTIELPLRPTEAPPEPAPVLR